MASVCRARRKGYPSGQRPSFASTYPWSYDKDTRDRYYPQSAETRVEPVLGPRPVLETERSVGRDPPVHPPTPGCGTRTPKRGTTHRVLNSETRGVVLAHRPVRGLRGHQYLTVYRLLVDDPCQARKSLGTEAGHHLLTHSQDKNWGLLSFNEASEWNRWSEEENLVQLSGHLRGRALIEWQLMEDDEKSEWDKALATGLWQHRTLDTPYNVRESPRLFLSGG